MGVVIVNEEYVTVTKAAELMKISPSTLWRWLKSGDLPAYRLGQRRVLIRRDDLETMITPFKPKKGDAMVEKERARLSRPLDEGQRQAALAALAAARTLRAGTLKHRNGHVFSDSTDIIREMREEQTDRE